MENVFRKFSLAVVAGGMLVMGGCASVDDVKRAQATADQALDAAHQAQQSASTAQSAAQGAQQSADQAKAGVSALDQKVQGVQQNLDSYKADQAKHRGQRG